MTTQQLVQSQRLEIQYPLQLVTDKQNVKEYNLKKLEGLALESLGEIPQLDELTEEQEQWFERRMRGPARSWERWFWFVDQYFTEEQKRQLRLSDKDMEGKGID
jgi:hypothetical protein